jgi:homoserine dehydrogenase
MASSTERAITFFHAWSSNSSPSRNVWQRRRSSATPRRTRLSTSADSTPRTSSPFSHRSPFDTAHKLSILTSLAFGTKIDASAVDVEGIQGVTLADIDAADELGFRIKLLGVAQRTAEGVEQRVHPTMVRKTTSIAQVMGVTNAVTIDADAVHELTLVGPGAGGDATASAVVADIADIARGVRSAPFGVATGDLVELRRTPMRRHEGGYYIRLSVPDVAGAFARIATRMAERSISLESIMQRGGLRGSGRASADPVGVILITHATSEHLVREALDVIYADGVIAEKPQVIRIERE